MDKELKYNKIIVIYGRQGLILRSPHKSEFKITKDIEYNIKIEQNIDRKIIITSNKSVSKCNLYNVLENIEKLLMLFDGMFIPIKEIKLNPDNTNKDDKCDRDEMDYINNRLRCYISKDYFNIKLVNFESVISDELFCKWEDLLKEINIVHQVYLYSLCNNGMTIDINCAFLIELAEPLVEIVKHYMGIYASLNPGSRGTTLKNCLDALIIKYGEDIFKNEIKTNYDEFLSRMVNSRVKIMHIKRNWEKKYFNGEELALYLLKISLLYRKIIFNILNIKETEYKDKLDDYISKLNDWNGIQKKFLEKISKK